MPESTRLKVAIAASGLSAAEVARRIGKDKHQLNRWANAQRTPALAVMFSLSRVLRETPAAAEVDCSVTGLWPETAELLDPAA